mgnify:CR=1 FL=1
MSTEWFVWCQRDRTTNVQRAIVAGPYATQEEATAAHWPAVNAVETSVRGGEAPAGTLSAKLGRV